MKPPNLISSIKDHIDLVAVVETAGVDLKPQGSRYVGLCPFHNEKVPSFCVFDDGHWKCFGCGEYGDVIDFVEKLHGCDFKQAKAYLGVKDVQPPNPKKVKELKRKRQKVEEFKRWEIEAADQVAILCRASHMLLANIQDSETFEKYGVHYHYADIYEYHLEILTSGDHEAKQALRDARYYG
jgi:DNA primase